MDKIYKLLDEDEKYNNDNLDIFVWFSNFITYNNGNIIHNFKIIDKLNRCYE